MDKTKNKNKQKIRRWMQDNVDEHWTCGAINATSLAENAAQEFDIYENDSDYTIPDELFDLAAKIAEEAERKNCE